MLLFLCQENYGVLSGFDDFIILYYLQLDFLCYNYLKEFFVIFARVDNYQKLEFFMNYTVLPSAFSSVFTVPCSAVDNCIKIASETQLKVLLCAMRNLANGIESEVIAELLGLHISDVEDALLYWCQSGILASNETITQPEKPKATPVIVKNERPTRTDVAERGLKDPKVRFLMQEAQCKFGRNLKTNESSLLLWLYDDQGLDISVIIMLLHFAATENKLNIRFIEKTALYWIENGVQTVVDAEKQIAYNARRTSAWHIVESVFGIERRQPSTKELELSDLWINEWNVSRELLKSAYDTCIDSKSKFSFPYIAKILENWHKNDFNTAEEVKNVKQRKQKTQQSFAAYDIDAFEKMLNSNDD